MCDFGAFVDIGVKQVWPGPPQPVPVGYSLKVGDIVDVELSNRTERGRIGISIVSSSLMGQQRAETKAARLYPSYFDADAAGSAPG
jgi:hypothetical protein